MSDQASGQPSDGSDRNGDGGQGAGELKGGCNCGAVRLRLRGAPVRTGLCHCLTCRKETGAPFMAFGVWTHGQATITGETRSWRARTDRRHFCPRCGSTLYSTTDGTEEVEVRLGTLDAAPSALPPGYELWTARREPWLPPVPGAAQHAADRP